ncbi:porin [Massilia sp. CMS3.1]|uniref:porin n=1 Tax=Massilia sp. CMS3.1 TaxID=3373083 RepID=UPI003EE5F9CF
MNKTLIAAAVLALAAGAAQAQSAIAIYGIADAGLLRESGGSAGTVNKIGSGMGSYSRIGFRGSEEIGGGMTALFTLENGHRLDTGEVDAAGSMFNRQAFVGIKGKAGMVTIGRQYTPWHQALAQVGDPFATGYAGGSKNVFPDFGANVRTSNTVMYTTPAVGGFVGDIAYAMGEQSGSSKAGRNIGASLGYAKGPLNVRLAYNNKNSDVAAAPGVAPVVRSSGSNKLLAANYDFKVVKAYLAFSVDKGFNAAPLGNANNPYGFRRPTASTDGNEVLLGVVAPVGPGNVIATLMRKDDQTSFDQDARSWGIGYLYALSKRSTIYTVYGHMVNKNGAGYTVANNTDAGTGDRALNLGVRHTF